MRDQGCAFANCEREGTINKNDVGLLILERVFSFCLVLRFLK